MPEILTGIKFGGWVIAIRILCKYKTLADFNLAVEKIDCQTTQFNSLPNFPALYIVA